MAVTRAKDSILDAAERIFAQHGYSGTSMRLIAEEAGVAQALIHYHCKTKENLFELIIERRSTIINRIRRQELKQCFDEAKGGIPTLEDVLQSFIRPAIESGRYSWGREFSQILAKLANSDDNRSRDLVHKYYDPIAREYIEALKRVLPELPEAEVYWGYLITTSAVVSSMARTGRINRLSAGMLDEDSNEQMIVRLIQFAANGLRGLSALAGLNVESQKTVSPL
ncbi:TetR family transcriptional regulator [bacterium]|nr:TetR family transcriptional regulator [bacterium]